MKKFIIMTLAIGALFGLVHSQEVRSANLTSVSVTLSTPRLSFYGLLTDQNSVGSSVVNINTTPGAIASTTSAQLAEGDVVWIGDAGTGSTYTVASASSTPGTFTIKSPSASSLGSGDADENDAVISTQSAEHTVRFTTATAITNGRFRILVPTVTPGDDGIPDQGGFDFGASAPTVTCPSNADTTYDFVTGTATASAVTLAGVTYHSYECAYSGTGGNGTVFDGSTNDAIVISSIINPTPLSDHVEGYADTYKIIVQHLDGNFLPLDSTTVSIGVIESVRITATVPPQITFGIIGLASGTSACGVTTDVSTTATTVPFGEISISSFTNAAQALTVSTNATNGFAVTAIANDEMGLAGQECSGNETADANCIPDADVASMTHTTSQDWTATTDKGLGYSLDDVGGTTNEAFSYDESARTYSAKHFADNEASQTPQTIFSATSPQENDNLYVCYRIVVSATQPAGDYENLVTYRATATF